LCWMFTFSDNVVLCAGEFKKTQLELAGLPVPEGNAGLQGELNINPGADEDNLEHWAAKNNHIFGGEGGATLDNTRPRSPPIDPFNPNPFAGVPEAEEGEGELVTKTEMTWTKQPYEIPGFDHEGSTKSMFLVVFDVPAGTITANPTLNQDLMSCDWKFDELGHGLDAAAVFEDVGAVRGQGHVIAHARELLEAEIINDESLVRGSDDQLSGTVLFDFAEKVDVCLFNPVTHHEQNIVCSETIPVGRVCTTLKATGILSCL